VSEAIHSFLAAPQRKKLSVAFQEQLEKMDNRNEMEEDNCSGSHTEEILGSF